MANKVLLTGIKDYQRREDRVPYAYHDLNIFLRMLKNYGWLSPYIFNSGKNDLLDSSDILYNQKCTVQNVVNSLRFIFKSARKGDLIVYYFTGHGVHFPTESDNALLMRESDSDGNTSHFLDRDMTLLLQSCPQDITLISVLDCCYSGGMLNTLLAKQPKNHVVLASSAADKKSKGGKFENEGGKLLSKFTYALFYNQREKGLQKGEDFEKSIRNLLQSSMFSPAPTPDIYIPNSLKNKNIFH